MPTWSTGFIFVRQRPCNEGMCNKKGNNGFINQSKGKGSFWSQKKVVKTNSKPELSQHIYKIGR
jgi:hypothetical protein